MKNDLRFKFYHWLRKVAKVPEACVSPKWLRIVFIILYPIHGAYAHQAQVRYDWMHNYYVIRDVKISGCFFDFLTREVNEGKIFKLIKNEDGLITIETIDAIETSVRISGEDLKLMLSRSNNRRS